MPGPDAVVAKYAMNPGCCQCVALGTISRSTSARIDSIDSGVLGRRRRERRADRPRLDGREDRLVLDALEVIGHPIDDGVRGGAERRRVHVEEPLELGGIGGAVGQGCWTDVPTAERMSLIWVPAMISEKSARIPRIGMMNTTTTHV